MFKSTLGILARNLLGVLVTTLFIGCSGNSPVAPTNDLNKVAGAYDNCPNCPQVNFSARVMAMEQATRRLMFAGEPDTVIAMQNCEVFKLSANHQVRAQFSDIRPGDSVEVTGHQEANGDVVAQRLRIMASDGTCGYDLAFRDSIATIDYANGTFTVFGRSETILIDENTVIWGTKTTNQHQALTGQEPQQNQSQERYRKDEVIPYAFTDLEAGDVLEIRADIVNETTLLAISIKIANCSQKQCITFDAPIATIDLELNQVTFVGVDWIGTVCNNALLLGVDGNPIALEDLAVGTLVSVKGFPTSETELKICKITILPSL